MEKTERLVRTGIAGLDAVFGGGILRGNVILVTGEVGSGKSLFGTEFVYRGIVEDDEPGIIVVFETSPAKLLRDATGFGWNLQQLEEQNRLRIVFTTPQVLEQELRSPDSLLLEIAAEIGARRIFIDSISQLRSVTAETGGPNGAPGSYRELLLQVIEGLARENLTAIFSHELIAHQETAHTLEVAQYLTDTVIRLQRGNYSQGVYRRLEILKSRGQSFDPGEHTLRIAAGRGLEVFRRVQAVVANATLAQPTSTHRHSASGNATLADLTGGGIYEGSVTLVVGASGTGKSVLGYQVLAEGARLGRRSLLVTLDEHPAQILRNADLLCLGLREQVEAGMVHILHDSPLELEVNTHFHDITQIVEAHDIEQVVVDGISTYANAIHDQRSFREFFHGLIDFAKNRLMTTFISYENPEVFGITRFMIASNISSLVDNIFLLSYVELGNTLHRAITVAKARGSKHSQSTREYRIEPGGITLVPEEEGLHTASPFRQYYNLLSRAPTRFSRDGGSPPSGE